MSEWWTYTLSDLQSFSLQTYYRLLELYNAAIWPTQVAAFALGLVIVALRRRAEPARGRLVAAILAGCWLWVAIAFTRPAIRPSTGAPFTSRGASGSRRCS